MYLICEDADINAVDQLMTYNFAGFADEVEKALSFKARNVDPRLKPNYSRILYSWYTLRGDYRNGTLYDLEDVDMDSHLCSLQLR